MIIGMSRDKHKSVACKELHNVAKQPGKGVRLTLQSKSIIDRVRQFFFRERGRRGHPKENSCSNSCFSIHGETVSGVLQRVKEQCGFPGERFACTSGAGI